MSKTRKRGPIKCKPDSEEAKRIEKTHGFNAAKAAQIKRADDAKAKKPAASGSAAEKGDQS